MRAELRSDRLAGRLLTNVPSYIDRATKHVGPIVEERRLRMKEAKEVGEEWDEKPVSTMLLPECMAVQARKIF